MDRDNIPIPKVINALIFKGLIIDYDKFAFLYKQKIEIQLNESISALLDNDIYNTCVHNNFYQNYEFAGINIIKYNFHRLFTYKKQE